MNNVSLLQTKSPAAFFLKYIYQLYFSMFKTNSCPKSVENVLARG